MSDFKIVFSPDHARMFAQVSEDMYTELTPRVVPSWQDNAPIPYTITPYGMQYANYIPSPVPVPSCRYGRGCRNRGFWHRLFWH